ncbi:MAG: hypothetical protein BRC30_02885 [Nanohaloarchaea archaeon SW_7_46_7]|nr:MAG: hypothetical protein BRC30_02885 [Nanohaloarchaea archaeon SW_7_46_7]
MPSCDICGEEFDTERGLHIHQSQKHEEETGDAETEEEETVEEESSGEEVGEEQDSSTESDEVVEEIENETSGGLLGGFSRESIFVGGAFVGIALGLIAGLFLSQGGTGFDQASPAEVQQSVEGLPGVNMNVSSVTEKNGVYQVNASVQSLTGQTQEQTVAHVSLDNELIFLQGMSYEDLRAQLEAAQQQQPPTGNQTATNSTQPSGNETQ